MQPFGWYRALMQHPQYRWLALLGSLIYLISPIDLAPDVLPIIGQVDDIILFMVMMSAITQTFFSSNPSEDVENGFDGFSKSSKSSRSNDPTVQTVDVNATSVD
ncbi:MAG: DUF1232 domain-containing protein [Symploca sp. SIO2B6]|nr:DUF1232 domain-containing protein [Symploca sp. SIO2B6]